VTEETTKPTTVGGAEKALKAAAKEHAALVAAYATETAERKAAHETALAAVRKTLNSARSLYRRLSAETKLTKIEADAKIEAEAELAKPAEPNEEGE